MFEGRRGRVREGVTGEEGIYTCRLAETCLKKGAIGGESVRARQDLVLARRYKLAVRLSPELKDWKLDWLYDDLQDTRPIYVFDPNDGFFQKRLILHTILSEEKRRMDHKTQKQAAQNIRSDRSMIEGP